MIAQVASAGSSRMPIMTDGAAISMMASKEDVRGGEDFKGDQRSAPFITRWVTSYHGSIDPDLVSVPKNFVLEYESRRYDIESVSVIGRKAGLEILTLARQG